MRARLLAGLATASLMLSVGASAQDRAVPYWASIASGQAMMRTGPGRTYPGIWLYQRRDLPVKVVQRHESWRKVEDPDGIQGWMLVALLSERRTAMVKEGAPRPLRAAPDEASATLYRAEAGVVGRIEQCDGRHCRFTVGKRAGFIAQSELYGLDEGEAVE